MTTATGLESPEPKQVAGVAFSFPANGDNTASSGSPSKLPRRLRRRLLQHKTPATAGEIDAKLKEAELRRLQYYESLSNKARPKPKILSPEEDLVERLRRKLSAAEHNRLQILALERMRLAMADEARQSAKTELEMCFEKERKELGLKVESRIQKAQTNRMLLRKAYMQRRAAQRERHAQSLTRKMIQDEGMRAAIYQKCAVAEKKRLGLLEAGKRKARARVSHVHDVAKSVYYRREMDIRRRRYILEHRLLRAQKQRAEYLRQRPSLQSSLHGSSKVTHEQRELFSAKLARCWRQFVRLKKTTFCLVNAYKALGIDEKSAKSMPFEQLARLLESPETTKSVKAMLDRLETRLRISTAATSSLSSLENVDHLLKRIASPNKRGSTNFSSKKKGVKAPRSGKEFEQGSVILPRYPVRVVLCAYMILGHPDAVFSGKGEREVALVDSAVNFITEFELLIKTILSGSIQTDQEEASSNVPLRMTFRSQLKSFDAAWCSYLYRFVAWKVKDAKLLEEDLVRAACQMELSMMQACKLSPGGDNSGLTHGMMAIQKQVLKDQNLLREQVQHLSGYVGLQHMESALSETRSRFSEAKKSVVPLASPSSAVSSSSLQSSSNGVAVSISDDGPDKSHEWSNITVSSLFGKDDSMLVKEIDLTTIFGSAADGRLSSDESLVSENELLVNAIVHGHCHSFADILNAGDEDRNTLKVDLQAKVRETMEKAFWDGIMESMKQDEPDFGWVLKLMTEVRDELCKMSPQSWKHDIVETIDIDVLSKVLRSGIVDMDYFGKVLEFALAVLRKLSAPATDDEMKTTHPKLLKELSDVFQAGDKSSNSLAFIMMRGLRFILQEIQTLKREITKARMKIVEPLIKGPAGLVYLRKAFADRYGPPTGPVTALPLTKQWLSSFREDVEREWNEYKESLSTVTTGSGTSLQGLPPTALRTGGNTPMMSKIGYTTSITTGNEQPECTGGKVDMSVRLGLLKLVSKVVGLTREALPETMKLNLSRLRTAQAQLQKIIVISTSILVLRQTLLSEKLVTSTLEMESLVSQCIEKLSDLLDSSEEAGTMEIVETVSQYLEGNNDQNKSPDKHQTRKQILENMLVKSMQADDAIFAKVSRTVYTAARGVVFGGSGVKGKQLAEMELRRLGAALLTDKVLDVAEMVVVVANVSCSVHGAWYEEILNSM